MAEGFFNMVMHQKVIGQSVLGLDLFLKSTSCGSGSL
ncbi:MAG: hypothetical protein ACJ70U_07725 [Nitrososphaera sp.]